MRSKLFVPASRPDWFGKALASAADALSFDLEDAVAPDRKDSARADLSRLLDGRTPCPPEWQAPMRDKTLIVRVNAVGSVHFSADLRACVWPALHLINLPKVESGDTVRQAAAAIAELERERGLTRALGLLVNIESPRGLRLVAEIAASHPRVVGLQIGYGDLFAPLGIASGEPSATQAVRLAVRLAAGEAGIAAYDGAWVNFSDGEGFERDCQAARQIVLAVDAGEEQGDRHNKGGPPRGLMKLRQPRRDPTPCLRLSRAHLPSSRGVRAPMCTRPDLRKKPTRHLNNGQG